MVKRLYQLLILFLFSGCGTTGHVKFYDFNVSKYDVEKEIIRVIRADSVHQVPNKWLSHTAGDYFERIYIYFANSPEELYQVGFTGDSTEWNISSTCRLGLISIYQGDQFQYQRDLSSKEIIRIQNRFEQEVLRKIKYT